MLGLTAAVVAAQMSLIQQSAEQAGNEATTPVQHSCLGADAIVDEASCPDAFIARHPIDTAYASHDLDPDWCLTLLDNVWRSCVYGDEKGPNGTIALVGDSHAAAMIPAFDEYFETNGWRVETFTRFGCPGLTTVPEQMVGKDAVEQVACMAWTKQVRAELQTLDDIDVVAYTDWSRAYFTTDDPARHREFVDEIDAMWRSVQSTGKKVVFVRDPPAVGVGDVPTCLAAIAVPALAPCSRPRVTALTEDTVLDAIDQNGAIPVIDTSRYFCTSETCLTYVGGVVTYADSNHLSDTYARSIAPYLGDELMAAIDDVDHD